MNNENSKDESSTVALSQMIKQFRLGAAIFFAGIVGIFIINQAEKDSLTMELLAAGCLVVMAAGFFLAIASEIKFLMLRLGGCTNKRQR